MWTIESDTDSSYQSDHSDINFIPGIIEIEDSEAHKCSKRALKRARKEDVENMPGLAYSEEPLADEEWTKTYQQGQNERIV